MWTEKELGLDDELFDMLLEIDDIIEEFGVECDIHRDSDDCFPDYSENDACVIVINPNIDRNVEMYFSDKEITLCFADWHAHYATSDFSELRDTFRDLLTNVQCAASVYLGAELRWNESSNILRIDAESMTPDEAFAGSRIMAQVYKERWEKNGAEVRFLFWDPNYDKIITIEKR